MEKRLWPDCPHYAANEPRLSHARVSETTVTGGQLRAFTSKLRLPWDAKQPCLKPAPRHVRRAGFCVFGMSNLLMDIYVHQNLLP